MLLTLASSIFAAVSHSETILLRNVVSEPSVSPTLARTASESAKEGGGRDAQKVAPITPFTPNENAHVDRVLPAAMLRPDAEAVAETKFGRRAFTIEGRVDTRSGPLLRTAVVDQGQSPSAVGRAVFFGTHIEAARETYNYGTWEAKASITRAEGDTLDSTTARARPLPAAGGTMLLGNSGFPLTSTMLFDVNVGNIGLDISPQLSGSGRLSLASRSALRGIGATLRSVDGKVDARFGIATAGTLEADQYPVFTPASGRLAWAAFGYRATTELKGGVQLIQASRVREDSVNLGPALGNLATDTTAADATSTGVTTLAAGATYGDFNSWREGASPWAGRVTALMNRVDLPVAGLPSTRWGVFGDARYRNGRFEHTFNAVFASPALIYGDRSLQTPTVGASWNSSMQQARLGWGAGLDFAQFDRADKSSQSTRLSANANASWRFGRDEVIFGSAAAAVERGRLFDTTAESAFQTVPAPSDRRVASAVFGYRFPFWGVGLSAVTASARRNEAVVANGTRATGLQVGWEHDWYSGRRDPSRMQIRTAFGIAMDNSESDTRRYPTASVSLRTSPDRDWLLDASLRYSASNGNLSLDQGFSASANALWRVAPGWSTGLSLSVNEARFDFRTDSPVLLPSRRSERRATLWLRWDGASGSPYLPLGQQSRGIAGAGAISGYVWFAPDGQLGEFNATALDANGAAGVEVWLDQRYRAITDAKGRYEFPLVPVGVHGLEVASASVPLPWELTSGRGVTIDVQLRGTAGQNFTLRRIVEVE